jgi:cysteinyl-tRNA synthetase
MYVYAGYSVDHVCNLTDVDDKIIVKMASENKSLLEITEIYTKAFFEDLDVLNIKRAKVYPKATEHIVVRVFLFMLLEIFKFWMYLYVY